MRQQQSYKFNNLSLGTCYYPEHWDESLWLNDLERMKKTGISIIRIGEFAWNKIEPSDGVFDFSFFDKFLDLCESQKIKVIFGTPTATPPVWLTEKYPEVLNATKDGVLFRHGLRRHYNYNSPVYQKYCARIVTKIAEHYAKRSCIIGWQIDNELNCEVNEFYSQADTLAFRQWLKIKYKTLDNLNKCWGTVVWNQTYNDWNELYVPRPTTQNCTNPHQQLDYYRFVSDSAIRFCNLQSSILRKYVKPGDFITTNGMFGNLDNHKMTDKCLDLYCYDSYPNFAYENDITDFSYENMNDRKWSKNLSEVRSVCSNFGIMEQQSGANGWNTRMDSPAPKPGQVMLWAMQSIAHGADFVSFFRWRTACMGTEIYWHGILDYDNKDNRKLKELNDIRDRVEYIQEIVNSKYKASVAVVKDYDNIFDSQLDVWHKKINKVSEKGIFEACQKTHTPLDYVYITSDTEAAELKQYDVLFYPHPVMANPNIIKVLTDYVNEGGTLIIGARSGMKDITGQCPMTSMPGLFSSLTDTSISDFTFVGPADGKVTMNWNGINLDTGIFNDIIECEGTKARPLAYYNDNYYKDKVCLTATRVSYGSIIHYGGTFTEEVVREFLSYTGCISPFAEHITAPETVEIAVRQKDGYNYIFVLNYMPEEVTINLKSEMKDLDTLNTEKDLVVLGPYETKVYRL